MLRSTTRQGTDYGAQRDLEGEGVLNDSRNRGPEHRTLRKDPESDVGPRSRSSSRESKFSGSMGSPKGSPVAGKNLGKERIAEDIKREDDRDYARFKFLGGLKELGRLAPGTTEAVVAVANGPGLYKALLLDMGVPRDSIEKVMQIYLSCYGQFLAKDEGKGKSHHRGHRDRRDNEDEVKQASSGRGSGGKDHRGDRRSNGERGYSTYGAQLSSREDSRGYREPRNADREVRGRDLPVWTNTTLKNLSYDGSTEWETFIHRFKLVAGQMGLDDREKAEFLVSTLKGGAFKAIMYAQRVHGEVSFQDICRRLETQYEGDFSSPAAAWSKLDQAFQQREESLFHWSDRLNSIGDSIFRVDIRGRNSIERRLVSKFCFAAWDRAAGVKAMEQGPPKSLEEAVESVRGYQQVQWAADNNCAERPRAKVRGWSPEREKLDCRDQYPSRRDDVDSRPDRYRGSSRAVQSQSAYRARSPEFRRYEGSLSRAEDAHDRERDSRDKYQVRAVTGGLEAVVAELTKQVGGLTQEVTKQVGGLTQELRGVKSRLDSMDSRLAKVEAWEGRFIKIEDRLDSVEKQLRERIESPTRRRSPSPGSRCFACGGEGHCRSECPRPPTLTVEDRIRCLVCGERGHNNASCSRSGSRSSSPKGQGN